MIKNYFLLISVIVVFFFSCKKEDNTVVPPPIVSTVKDTLKCSLSTQVVYDTNQIISYVRAAAAFTNNSGWYFYPPDSVLMNNIYLNFVSSSSSSPFRYFSASNPAVSPINFSDSLSWDCKGSATLPAFKKKNMQMSYIDYSYLPIDSISISQNTVIQHPIIFADEIWYIIHFAQNGATSLLHSHNIIHYGSSSGFTIDIDELNYTVLPLNQFYFVVEMKVFDTKVDYPLDTIKIMESTSAEISKKVYPKN
ncbi:MAG: hypothetical protein L6Q66_01450 [Bacteroidia bacterium]|nr:hypothetical protein [Bacteroidia bacterium]